MSTYQIAKTTGTSKQYITGQLLYNEGLQKMNAFKRAETSEDVTYSLEIWMPQNEVVDPDLDFSHLETTPSEDEWPTVEALVEDMKESILEDIQTEVVWSVESASDVADRLFPDVPQGLPANKAEAALEAYHSRAVSLMDQAIAEVEKWIEAGCPEAKESHPAGSIHFEIDGEEFPASITTVPRHEQAIQFSAPGGTTLWLHKPERTN